MIFDTHAHYEDAAFDEDRELLLGNFPSEGIYGIVNAGSSWETLEPIRQLTEKYDYIYGAYGIHPDHVSELSEEGLEELRALLRSPKAVAVGEIGLDYHWSKENREEQIYWFERQLELARQEGLPVVIHSRDAAGDTMDLARKWELGTLKAVMHCYSYSVEQARIYLDMGLYLGIGGVLTFKNARQLKEVVREAPLDRLVLETDCPYLSPEPHRGRRNSSRNLPYVVRAIAELKGCTEEEIESVTWENALRFYAVDPPGSKGTI